MKNKSLFCAIFGLLLTLPIHAQTDYQNHEQRTKTLQNLSASNGPATKLSSIGKSRGNRDIWLLTLAKGNPNEKPAILIVAGLDGAHPAGSEIALRMVEELFANSANDSIANLLDTKTVYIVPAANPDALEQVTAKLKYNRSVNTVDYDNDRDGRINEDPFEDLDKNGLITHVRIEDETGKYIVSEDDPRLLVEADASKGERGKYLLISEGIDNDNDGEFNEDPEGGVNIDRNFPFNYPVFTDNSGNYAASEHETRAILDFLYNSPNIFAVLTLGPHNNLTDAPKYNKTAATQRIIKAPLKKDVDVMKQVSDAYNSIAAKNAPKMPHSKGNFAQTAYYHAGRFSFSTPGWWVPEVEKEMDTTEAAKIIDNKTAGKMAKDKGKKTSGNAEVKFLEWAASENLTNVFVPWQAIEHPDFKGKKAEVGGFTPYVKLNPPVKYLTKPAKDHVKFLGTLGMQMPQIELVNIDTEAMGNGLNRLTVKVINKGSLPTHAEIGNKVRWVMRLKTEMFLDKNQSLVTGRKINLRDALAPGESQEYSWLVNGKGKLTLKAGCPTTGVVTKEINLK